MHFTHQIVSPSVSGEVTVRAGAETEASIKFDLQISEDGRDLTLSQQISLLNLNLENPISDLLGRINKAFESREVALDVFDKILTTIDSRKTMIAEEQKSIETLQYVFDFFSALRVLLGVPVEQAEQEKQEKKILDTIINIELQPAEHGYFDVDVFSIERTVNGLRLQNRLEKLLSLSPTIAAIILCDSSLLRDYFEASLFQSLDIIEKVAKERTVKTVESNLAKLSFGTIENNIKEAAELAKNIADSEHQNIDLAAELNEFFKKRQIFLPQKKIDQMVLAISQFLLIANKNERQNKIAGILESEITINATLFKFRENQSSFITGIIGKNDETHQQGLLRKYKEIIAKNDDRNALINQRSRFFKLSGFKWYPGIEFFSHKERQTLAKILLTKESDEIAELLRHPDRILQVAMYGWPQKNEWLIRSPDERIVCIPPTAEQRRELEGFFVGLMKSVFAFPVELSDQEKVVLKDKIEKYEIFRGEEIEHKSACLTKYTNGGLQAERLFRLASLHDMEIVNTPRHSFFSASSTQLFRRIALKKELLFREANDYIHNVSMRPRSDFQNMIGFVQPPVLPGPTVSRIDADRILVQKMLMLRAFSISVGNEQEVAALDSAMQSRKIYELVDRMLSDLMGRPGVAYFSPNQSRLFPGSDQTHYNLLERLQRRLRVDAKLICDNKLDICLALAVPLREEEKVFSQGEIPTFKSRHEALTLLLRMTYALVADQQYERAQNVLDQAIKHPYFAGHRHWYTSFWHNSTKDTASVHALREEKRLLTIFILQQKLQATVDRQQGNALEQTLLTVAGSSARAEDDGAGIGYGT